MAEPVAGQVVRAGDSPAPRIKVKSGNETVSASTSLQDDNDFVLIPFAANKTYRVEVRLNASCTSTGDISTDWVMAGGLTQLSAKHSLGPELGSSSNVATLANLAVVNISGSTISFGLTSSGVSIHQEFLVETTTAGTSGTLTLRWAQQSSAGVTTLSNSSFMVITEIELI